MTLERCACGPYGITVPLMRPCSSMISVSHGGLDDQNLAAVATPRNSWADIVPIAAQGYHCDMKVNGTHTRTIWLEADDWSAGIIDQTLLPHRYPPPPLTPLHYPPPPTQSLP